MKNKWRKLIIFSLVFSSVVCLSPPKVEAMTSGVQGAKGSGFFELAGLWDKKYKYKPTPRNQTSKEIVGYFTKDWPTDNQSYNSLKGNPNLITGLATFSFKLDSSGGLVGEIPAQALKTSWENGVETLALIHNLTSSKFDSKLIHSILSSPKLESKLVSNIYQTVLRNGFDGVHIDFENIPAGDRKLFNLFLDDLQAKFAPEGLKVTIAVPAKTCDNPSDAWSGAYDYRHIASRADQIMLMTYDEHWLSGAPGPVASQPWVDKVIKYSTEVIPADKLFLGIGNYGYDWVVGKDKGHRAIPAKNVLPLAWDYGADIKWDEWNQTPFFYYWKNNQKHVIWFESNQSAAFKLDMVNKYNLKGIAIWRLGFEAPGFWEMVAEKFNNTK